MESIKNTDLVEYGLSEMPLIILPLLTTLTSSSPYWAVLFATASAMMTAWGKFGQNRIVEFAEFIDKNKELFSKKIIESDDFKSVFLNVLERHIKEISEEKRKLLRNYFLNVGKGIHPEFNEHTRLLNTLDTISPEEIKMLKLFDSDELFKRWQSAHQEMSLDVQSMEQIIRESKLSINFSFGKNELNNQTLLLLGYKGLLYVLSRDNFGSGVEAKTKNITDFGQKFLDFIKN